MLTRGGSPDKTEVCGSSPQWPTFEAKNPQNTLPQKGKDHSPGPVFQSYPATLQDLSLSKLIDGFILSYKLEGKSPLTIDSHQRKLNRYLVYVKDNPLTAITPAVIRGFLGWVRDDYNLDAATVQRYFITLKAFYRWAIEEGFTNENPTTKIRLAKPSQKVIRGLLPEQIKTIIDVVKGDSQESARNKAIILILLDCGIRVSELANLKIDDVDMKRGVIIVMGKGSKQRLARLGLKTQKALWNYMVYRKNKSPWLWINRNGKRLTATGVQQMIRELGWKVGIRLYPHLLRHTFAISFLRNEANTFECQYALGHSSLEMTRRYCQALSFDDVFRRHELASPVDNALGKWK